MSPLLVPVRRGPEAVEWMDEGVGTPAEDADAYRLLDRVNRWQAGHRLTLDALDEALAAGTIGADGPFTFLDLAGGDGGFAARVAEWAAARGRIARPILLDLNPAALAAARERGAATARVRADALSLPVADRTVDCVHASCFFHHLSTLDARDLLAEMCRASRGLVVVNDLVRSWLAAGSTWAATRLLVENRLVRHDGPLSVLKAFRPAELLDIAHASGAAGWRWQVERAFPYRMALIGARVDPR
ncbi:MAG TPA: methyltransferase domain-containing protein [Gemmatimonadota bacterium]|nr:methyltransferase domain-containing protein [Gemmatimonadota bacterium]